MNLAGKRVLILGLGETGLSMARWVARGGASVRAADTRADPPAIESLGKALPQAEVITGPFAETLLDGVNLVAISPGVPRTSAVVQAALARGVEVVGDIELFARHVMPRSDTRVVAITGTNGKTTVTALTGALCRSAGIDCEVAGNISPAALTALMDRLDRGAPPQVWVLELSSFQLESTTSLAPHVATVLNVTADHLDRYPSVAEYAAAKARIFAGTGMQVLNRNDRASMAMRRAGRPVVTFGLGPALDHEHFGLLSVSGEPWLAKGRTPLLAVREMRLAGLHNAANALAALALCQAIGLDPMATRDALKRFGGLPHRVEHVGEIGGVAFYDDSKGTNVGATVAALAGLASRAKAGTGKVVLIAGGDGKYQDFAPLADAVAHAARTVVLIGRDAPLIAAAIAACGIPVARAETMKDAVTHAFASARAGDVVLLSPACASFDMFANYHERGEVFRAVVKELAHARAH